MNLRKPTPDLVEAACKEFDHYNDLAERTLDLLFKQFPNNVELPHVLLKVVTLNGLYSTQIFAMQDVAHHIQECGAEVDSAFTAGSAEIVDKIARVTIKATGKVRNNYSFATKYCSWHNPDVFPIWDARVDRYLWRLQKQEHFAGCLKRNSDLWEYPTFREAIANFRSFYGLAAFPYKQLDKYLTSQPL
jgi:hypothetical protein